MPTELVQVLGLEGPNLYGPQPGVFLEIRSDKDRARRLKDALKDGAQSIGMVIGYLELDTQAQPDGFIITANFTTPTPAIGVALVQYVVEGLNHQEAGDEQWDAEGPLWDLQKRRRAEALPLAALQITAEAASRGIPTLVRADGQIQLGYGIRSWAFDPARFKDRTSAGSLSSEEIGIGPPPFARPPAALEVPWEQIGPIPIIAVAGGTGSEIAAKLIAATLQAQRQAVRLATAADFDTTRTLLADPSAAIAVIGLTAEGIAQRGLAFERSAFSAVTELPVDPPPGIADRAELARVLGVPMLVTASEGRVALNADEPELVELSEYAPCPIIYFSISAENPTISFHRIEGGMALFVRDGRVIAAHGASEQTVAAATLPPEELPGALAGLAVLWGLGLPWEQITGKLASGAEY
jgi:Domain of unknown function (DUF4938)